MIKNVSGRRYVRIRLHNATIIAIRRGVPAGHPARHLVQEWQRRLDESSDRRTLTITDREVMWCLRRMLTYGGHNES